MIANFVTVYLVEGFAAISFAVLLRNVDTSKLNKALMIGLCGIVTAWMLAGIIAFALAGDSAVPVSSVRHFIFAVRVVHLLKGNSEDYGSVLVPSTSSSSSLLLLRRCELSGRSRCCSLGRLSAPFGSVFAYQCKCRDSNTAVFGVLKPRSNCRKASSRPLRLALRTPPSRLLVTTLLGTTTPWS